LKFTAFELGGALEFYKDTLRTFEIISIRSLVHRGRRAGAFASQIPVRGVAGVEKGRSTGTRSSWRIHRWPWEEEGMAGGEVPTAAEVAVEGSSSARRFPARRRAKFRLDSCSRMRRSFWGG
jgi:hypothetical protein